MLWPHPALNWLILKIHVTSLIEIGRALVCAEPGVDVVWLRDVLRAVKAAT